nr:MAG TPA: hypothetical protein [Caudoviricetes sp.]
MQRLDNWLQSIFAEEWRFLRNTTHTETLFLQV